MEIDKNKRKWIKRSILAGLGVSISTSLYVYNEVYNIEVNDIELLFPNLPISFDGYKIVQISDLHLSIFMKESYINRVFEIINKINANLLALTGDYITSYHDLGHFYKLEKAMTKINSNYKKYAVLGNHDYTNNSKNAEDYLSEMGINVLKNQGETITNGKDSFNILGVEDIWKSQADLIMASQGLNLKDFTLLLCHNPSFIKEAKNHPIDLMLSGHTHGGQVQLPFIGPLIVPTNRKYAEGLITENNTYLYVNRGLGVITPPVRFLCRPEISVFTLKAM